MTTSTAKKEAPSESRHVPLLIGGMWQESGKDAPVYDKYSGREIATVAVADRSHVKDAVRIAAEAHRREAPSPSDRSDMLLRTADLLAAAREETIETIVAEAGFTRSDATGELNRGLQTLQAAADECRRLTGEMIPIEGAPSQQNRIGFTFRVPVGVVCAITPFNSPLNTLLHKVAPAFAGGNALIVKPASATPLSAALVMRLMLKAGVPGPFLSLLNGPGGAVGDWLCAEEDVNFFAFTGSTEVGRKIHAAAGIRRTQMELGSIAATILHRDADLTAAMGKVLAAGFRKAGQVCTSIQRLYVHADIYDRVRKELAEKVANLRAGDPHDPATEVGPMIAEREAVRAEAWVKEAVAQGATLLAGGVRKGPLLHPTLLDGVSAEMRVMKDEIFAPVMVLRPYDDIYAAIAEINATPYGLATGIFTSDLQVGFAAARLLEVGGVHINQTSSSRVDVMPYGGCKASGFGREGPRYAIREMTEERLVTITLDPLPTH